MTIPRIARTRVPFVDVLRLLALAQMVNGHTLDAVMEESIRATPAFGVYDYLRGLVSVAFMAAAGFAYHLTTFARFDPVKARAGRPKRVVRSLWIIALGYFLKFSMRIFSDDPVVAERALFYFLRIDVLHCIGFSILMLELITAVSRSGAQARWLSGGLATFMIAAAPWGARVTLTAENRWWANWFTHAGDSFFPVTPWAAYVLLGAALGGLLLAPEPEARLGQSARLLTVGLGLLVFSALLSRAWPNYDLPSPSRPGFVVEKLGALLALSAPLSYATDYVTTRWGHLPRPLVVLTGETLIMYVVHLFFIFGTAWGPANLFPRNLALGSAFLVVLVILVLTVAVGLGAPAFRARFWAWLAQRNQPRVPDAALSS